MRLYKILWKDNRYGESIVDANSKKEAKVFAEEGLDHDFEELDPCSDWVIDSVQRIKEE